jgi:hypothetical protein
MSIHNGLDPKVQDLAMAYNELNVQKGLRPSFFSFGTHIKSHIYYIYEIA